MTTHFRSAARFLFVAAFVALAAAPAEAQYFGRNKVQYEKFDFQILKTENFDIYFYEDERQAVEHAARLAERWRVRLEDVLSHQLSGRQPLVLYAAQPHFQQTNTVGGEIGDSTGGVTEALRRRIVLPFAGPLADTDHVLGHELVHAFQFDITSRMKQAGSGGTPGALRLPLWFVEGMAEYLSIGPVDPHTAMWLRDAALHDRLPKLKDLDDPDYFPYRWGHAFWAYVGGRWGDRMIGTLLRDAAASGDAESAIVARLGLTEEEFTRDWHAAIQEAYAPVLKARRGPTAFGTVLAKRQGLGGRLNLAPAISPDGRMVAFLSERGLFSIDLFLADIDSGRVQKLTDTGISPHFSSLQFANSAGGWDTDSRRLAVSTIVGGRAALAIFDAASGRVEREVRLDAVDEVLSPTWSPDGSRIAFSAIAGGLTDLFVLELTSGTVTRLTSDPFTDIQPSWSPDGRRIAFATDRFTTMLDNLAIGATRLAVIDPSTKAVSPIRAFDRGKHINPQWAGDAQVVYFLSDVDGVTDVYRVSIDAGAPERVTDLQTGVSGITGSSPAMSAARAADRLALSVYEEGESRIYVTGGRIRPVAAAAPEGAASASTLPPLQRTEQIVASALRNPTAGLPPPGAGDARDYSPALGLDYVSQPTVAAGADRFGTYVGGGIALAFSDMLGNHTLFTAVQVNTSVTGDFDVKDLGGLIGYQNLSRRWNWGVSAEQVPYRTGFVESFIAADQGLAVGVDRTTIIRQTVRDVSGVTAYPFSRAHRIELGGGYRTISFDQQTVTEIYSLTTGELLERESETTSLGESLGFAETTAALVYDTSIFGATSPIAGQRYRLEVSPLFGDLHFTNALVDYRRYVMPVRFYTLAGRVLHFGRYGADSEDPRLPPLYLGYPTLVRGYDVGSFDASECPFDPLGRCPAVDRLLGSRMLVGNLEFRFPLLRPFGERSNMYGPVPVEVALFADAGVAWNRGERPSLFGGDREAVSSAGLALRVNAFGFAIAEFDFVRPFNRPDKGWLFQFSLSPGF